MHRRGASRNVATMSSSKLGIMIIGLLVACGASEHATQAPTAEPPASPPGPGEWATWSHAQKLAYMKSTVLPAEREVFARFEPVRFARLDCHTCHGVSANQGNFKMPNPELPKLVGGADGFGELAKIQPEVLKFMQQVVVPETARLLGVPAFDMEKHVGFSCYQCHTRSDR